MFVNTTTFKVLPSATDNLSDWQRYYQRLKVKGIYHSPDYIKLLEGYYRAEAELFIYGNESNFVYYPYFKRPLKGLNLKTDTIRLSDYHDIVSSWYYGGPVIGWNVNEGLSSELFKDFLDKFHEYCIENRIVSEFIRFDAIMKNHVFFEPLLDINLCNETVYVDLTQSEDKIWKSCDGRNRTSIRKALENNIAIEKNEDDSSIERFAEIYQNEMKRKNASGHYWFDANFFKKMKKELGERFCLFLIRHKKDIIGGGISLREAGVAHDYLAASLFEFWQYQPNNLLIFEEIKWCKAHGDVIYDLQGGRPGVFYFKSAFSSSRGKFYTASIIHDKSVYAELVDAAGKLGLNSSGKDFPKYRPAE